MIDNIEISPSNRAECGDCRKKIGKGTPRGVRTESRGHYTSNYYYCHKCSLKRIEEDIKKSKKLKKDFNKMIKEKSKELILMELKDE